MNNPITITLAYDNPKEGQPVTLTIIPLATWGSVALHYRKVVKLDNTPDTDYETHVLTHIPTGGQILAVNAGLTVEELAPYAVMIDLILPSDMKTGKDVPLEIKKKIVAIIDTVEELAHHKYRKEYYCPTCGQVCHRAYNLMNDSSPAVKCSYCHAEWEPFQLLRYPLSLNYLMDMLTSSSTDQFFEDFIGSMTKNGHKIDLPPNQLVYYFIAHAIYTGWQPDKQFSTRGK